MQNTYLYLSQPYNGTDAEKQDRADAGAEICLHLLKNKISVFSPIVHNHALIKFSDSFTIEERRDIFITFDLAMLRVAYGMIVLKLAGWEQSFGVAREIEFCHAHNIPIYYLTTEEILSAAPEQLTSLLIPKLAALN